MPGRFCVRTLDYSSTGYVARLKRFVGQLYWSFVICVNDKDKVRAVRRWK